MEKPTRQERATDHEKPKCRERAKEWEKTSVDERAIDSEKTKVGERAKGDEEPNHNERAIDSEKTRGQERAKPGEKPIKSERAKEKKETKKTERKMTNTKSLTHMVDAAVAVEKLRVASEVRQSHFALKGRQDPETDELHLRLKDLEDYVDSRVADLIQGHPAYPWFSRVKGVGNENIGKVVAPINIERATTISALWKFTGYSVEDGNAPRRVKGGGKLAYNNQLRSMCWRLASSLKRAKGCFYGYYIQEKEKYTERFLSQGLKILATPSGRWACSNCGASWAKKRDIGPCCNSPQIEKKLRQEPPGVIWMGHLDAMAVRKMIKLFLACLWLVWREAEGLPITKPYAIDKLGHSSYIVPWEMVDK
ncbi:hypothetical protein ES703_58408 [subsurface metagenome]